MIYWIVTALMIIAILLAIAIYYLWQLRGVRQREAKRLAAMEEESGRQRQRLNNSIQILAGAAGSEELTLTEASIRICGLLDSLPDSHKAAEEYAAFYHLREVTAHIPILEQWQALSRKEQLRLDRERLKLEEEHRERVLDAAQRIRGKFF